MLGQVFGKLQHSDAARIMQTARELAHEWEDDTEQTQGGAPSLRHFALDGAWCEANTRSCLMGKRRRCCARVGRSLWPFHLRYELRTRPITDSSASDHHLAHLWLRAELHFVLISIILTNPTNPKQSTSNVKGIGGSFHPCTDGYRCQQQSFAYELALLLSELPACSLGVMMHGACEIDKRQKWLGRM
mmetsp:Transcript_8298/g.22482  ORF Transcript_8298/g.22482 Transcript_8298/m.22482 type:complete len:188 (-) Transcript_8298:610-1173(-)